MNGYEVGGINDMILLKQIQIFLNRNLNNILKIVYTQYETQLGKRWFSINIQNNKIAPSPVQRYEEKMEIDDDDL